MITIRFVNLFLFANTSSTASELAFSDILQARMIAVDLEWSV